MTPIALALLLAAGGVAAQTQAPVPGKVAASQRQAAQDSSPQRMNWTAIAGQAMDLAAGGDGTIFALDQQGRAWMRRPGASTSWINLPGSFRRIAAAAENKAWAIADKGEVLVYNGTWWRPLEGLTTEAADVGASVNGSVFLVTAAGDLLALDERRGLLPVPGAPSRLVRVAVDDRDLPWALDGNGRVHRFDGKEWTQPAVPPARDLSVGNGGIWLIGMDSQLIGVDARSNAVRRVAAGAAVVATAPSGQPWIATGDGRIYANNPDTSGRKTAPRVERAQVFTQLLNWQRVIGSARQLAISSKGAILALGQQGEVWFWKSKNNWSRLPGSFARLTLDADNIPWGVTEEGKILRYQGSYWTDVPGAARDVVGGADGKLWALQPDGTLAHWQNRQRTWAPFPNKPPATLVRFAVAPGGQPWGVDEAGETYRFDGKQWEVLPERDAIDIGIGPEGSVFVVSRDKRLWRWDAGAKRWERLNGEASAVAVGPKGKPWVVTADARILASAFFDELPESQVSTVSVAMANAAANSIVSPPTVSPGGTAPATGSSGTGGSGGVVGQPGTGVPSAPKGKPDEPLLYRKVTTGKARDIVIGAEGSVFAITSEGTLARWSNTFNKFLSFPGQFSRLAVAPDGKPWGVSTKGEVFRYDGTTWKLVRNVTAQDVGIGYNGTVIVSDAQGYLLKYDPATDSFARLPPGADDIPPKGLRVAVDPAGKPWVINADGYVVRCDGPSCERLPVKARSLDIGPEGTIVIVDADRVLKRWNEREGTFERIPGIVDLVDLAAVGPRGKPWLLSANSDVWYSELFPRDESKDLSSATLASALLTAQSTASGTTTPPVFTFLINVQFDAISLPGGFIANPAPSALMGFRPDGKLVLIDLNGVFWNYDETRKTLVQDSTIPSPMAALAGDSIRSFAIGKDGTYWLSTDLSVVTTTRVFRREGGQWMSVQGVEDCAAHPDCGVSSPSSIAVAPDGSVYATSAANRLYRYDTTLKRFVKQAIPLPDGNLSFIAIDPSGRFWGGSPMPQRLYERVGNTWVRRDDAANGPDTPVLAACLFGQAGCVSIGANGSVYGARSHGAPPPFAKLVRWNSASSIWEVLNNSPEVIGGNFIVGPDGRPWVYSTAPPIQLWRAR